MKTFVVLFLTFSISGCMTHQSLMDQPAQITQEVNGDYRDLAECTIHRIEHPGMQVREKRRLPRNIEVFVDYRSLFSGPMVVMSATFFEKENNRTLIEIRGRWKVTGEKVRAEFMNREFVQPCLKGT